MTFDIKQHITNRVIERLEKVGEFEMPFEPFVAHNFKSGKTYRGINQLLLGFAGRSTPYWGTKKQWREAGAQIRAGEEGTQIVFWNFVVVEDEDDELVEKKIPFAKYYRVHNADQVDGWEPDSVVDMDETEVIDCADSFFANLKIPTQIVDNGRASYSPEEDMVTLPPRSAFKATKTSSVTQNYYGVKAHEYIHATGHKTRCDRKMPSYAIEELVAEIGSAMLCGQLGISMTVRDDHVAYIKSWLKALQNNKQLIFTAAGKSQAGVDWMNVQNAWK